MRSFICVADDWATGPTEVTTTPFRGQAKGSTPLTTEISLLATTPSTPALRVCEESGVISFIWSLGVPLWTALLPLG